MAFGTAHVAFAMHDAAFATPNVAFDCARLAFASPEVAFGPYRMPAAELAIASSFAQEPSACALIARVAQHASFGVALVALSSAVMPATRHSVVSSELRCHFRFVRYRSPDMRCRCRELRCCLRERRYCFRDLRCRSSKLRWHSPALRYRSPANASHNSSLHSGARRLTRRIRLVTCQRPDITSASNLLGSQAR